MSANIFILCWIFGGLLNMPLMIYVRKKFNRVRSQSLIDEMFLCIRYGPLLSWGIFLAGLDLKDEDRKAKIAKKRAKRLRTEKRVELLRIEALRIKNRFEILDL